MIIKKTAFQMGQSAVRWGGGQFGISLGEQFTIDWRQFTIRPVPNVTKGVVFAQRTVNNTTAINYDRRLV